MKKSINFTTSCDDSLRFEVVVRKSRSFIRVIDASYDMDVIDLTMAKVRRLRDWLTEYLEDNP